MTMCSLVCFPFRKLDYGIKKTGYCKILGDYGSGCYNSRLVFTGSVTCFRLDTLEFQDGRISLSVGREPMFCEGEDGVVSM